MISYWGVDHGEEIAKFDYGKNKPTAGRRFWAAGAPYGTHGAIAGKPGKKGRAFGNQLLGNTAGAAGGSMAGSALATMATRGRSPVATGLGAGSGALGGLAIGSQAGLARNSRKGYLQPQKPKR